MPNAYPLALAAGVLLGLLWLGLAPMERQIRTEETVARIDAGLVALFSGLLGGRLAYVLAHWGYFGDRPIESIWFWEGGLSWAGAAIGGLAGVALYDRITGRSVWNELDQLAIPTALVGASGWLGCLADACAYGRRTSVGPLTPPAPDLIGNLSPRWPTQAMGLIYTLLIVLLLFRLTQVELRPGVLGALALALLAGGALAIAWFRGDPVPVLAGLRLDGVSAGALLGLGLAGVALRVRS